jgi:hypothetical protein
MRLPWQRKPQASVDPRRPHAFRPKSDGGSSALAPLGGSVGGQVADIGIASASTRAMGCAVPGCGKPSDALVHAPEE